MLWDHFSCRDHCYNFNFTRNNAIWFMLANILIMLFVIFQLCIKNDLLLRRVWNGQIVLPFYKNEEDATQLSLQHLFSNGSNINTIFSTKYVQNQTLFNMIDQNINMTDKDKLKLLIDYNFDFEQLINVYDNVKHANGLIKLCFFSPNYEEVRMLFDHCKTLKKCKIDITHCDINRKNAIFYAAMNDINTFKYFLSNRCFPNHNQDDDKNVQIALTQTDIEGNTVAHQAANTPSPHIVDTFKLLKQYNFNFNVYNYYGKLPIHCACATNCASLLSWMTDENVFDINCETKYARNEALNDDPPLIIAVTHNNVECVDVLCKQTYTIDIQEEDVYRAIDNDNVTILKLLLCTLFRQCKISNWDDIVKQDENEDSVISSNEIKSMISYCKDECEIPQQCYKFLNDLFVNGYSRGNFDHIVLKLNYDLKTVINDYTNNVTFNDDTKISTDYEISENLGKGSFGLVQLGKDLKTGEKVAIKHITLNDKTPLQFITSEIESLKKLSTHSNIINLLSYKIFKNKVLLYFEYCPFGDLYTLLNQCDHFSMRISFKYFTQLLSAINTCHKMNIVHRDLKLQNILISDTFQLKVADFGLASMVDDKNDAIYNVGTPMYKSPELLEGYTSEYNIEDIIVLKGCDVFSLGIIFWQMMNGIEYLPFRLYKKPININKTKYQFIKYGQYNQFWAIHKNANMITMHNINTNSNNNNISADLLLNLFEQMFEYNPYSRITIDKILEHEWIVKHEDDISFYMNDSTLEAFVRARYHQTANENNKEHNNNDGSSIVSSHSGVTQHMHTQLRSTQTGLQFTQSSNISIATNSFNVIEFAKQINAQNSSQAIRPNNEPPILKNKIYNTFNPLVVMIGVEKYKNIKNKQHILNDYINVKTMLNNLIEYDLAYQNKNGKIVLSRGDGVMQSMFDDTDSKNTDQIDVNEQFQMKWTAKQLNNFNQDIVSNVINDKNNQYDGLIYFVSSYMKHDNKYQHYLYDSNDQLYHCNKYIFDIFNNTNCNKLYKKPKIFILDGFDPNMDEKENESQMHEQRMANNQKLVLLVDNNKIEFVDQYKRVLYSNCDWTQDKCFTAGKNDGNLLINSFCASLSNNIGITNSATDLNDIIKQTRIRLRQTVNKENSQYMNIYDENYIPSRCQILFTSFNPINSVESYFQTKDDITHLASIDEMQTQNEKDKINTKEKENIDQDSSYNYVSYGFSEKK